MTPAASRHLSPTFPPGTGRGLLVRGAIVCTAALLIALYHWNSGGKGQALDKALAYSYGISLCIWLLVDVARFPLRHWLRASPPHYWPDTWRAAAWAVCTIALGYVAGTAIGDAYAGHSTWDLIHIDPRRFIAIMVSSLAFSGLFLGYFYLKGKNESLQHQASEARLRLLESQLEPHMLFNTLANLRALIGTDPQQATAMLDRLNDYLRATLKASRSDAQPTAYTLAEEFARLDDYLAIMAMRMGPRLTYTLNLPTALTAHSLPALLLQPLVENSIRHGLEPSLRGGNIRVSAQADAQHLRLEVQDTGVGSAVPTHAGFGLTQVRERLAAAFGGQARLDWQSAPGQGTRAVITLPLQTPPP
jgi:signal transduction histidine kinase